MKAETMSFEDVIAQLRAWGSEGYRKMYARDGAGDNQFGVGLRDMYTIVRDRALGPQEADQLGIA